MWLLQGLKGRLIFSPGQAPSRGAALGGCGQECPRYGRLCSPVAGSAGRCIRSVEQGLADGDERKIGLENQLRWSGVSGGPEIGCCLLPDLCFDVK